ncbi:hypothetical protein BJX63DRAFT_404228 [Aspergillus granulosus]|uniref:Uncharacterized protein n=1 Tax=Aspergillus granulosus TaxID=176169 RepID=A0ABR4H301_9EURO
MRRQGGGDPSGRASERGSEWLSKKGSRAAAGRNGLPIGATRDALNRAVCNARLRVHFRIYRGHEKPAPRSRSSGLKFCIVVRREQRDYSVCGCGCGVEGGKKKRDDAFGTFLQQRLEEHLKPPSPRNPGVRRGGLEN